MDTYIDIEASVKSMDDPGCVLFDVPAMKQIEDLNRYRHVINLTQPDLIIQTGTAVGGSAMWFANSWIIYDGPDVITVDVDRDSVDPRVSSHPRITVLTGSSVDPVIVEEIAQRASKYNRVMVVLDSDHSSTHVCREIDQYAPLVSRGQYMVVEDGIYDFAKDGPFKPGPFDAVKKILDGRPGWTRDTVVEGLYPVSLYPGGWWIKQ